MEVEANRRSGVSDTVAVLGVGMHPWGRWGVHAARAALAEAGLRWKDIEFVSGAGTMRCGYPGSVAGATFAHALGWQGAEVNTSFGACASGGHALAVARARILAGDCEVALVVGADAAPGGFLAPAPGVRPDDPDWVRFRFGITNPSYLGLWARRRMHLHGATVADFSAVRVKNARHGSENPNARYRMNLSPDDVLRSAMVADPLRLFHIAAVSDGGAAIVLSSRRYAAKRTRNPVHIAAVSTATPRYYGAMLEMPYLVANLRDSPEAMFHAELLVKQAYERAGLGPGDLSLAEVYDLSSAVELDWYEWLGLCRRGEAEGFLSSGATTFGGRIPVNPSGGLACLGEVVAAQAIAQVCEVTWQLRGACGRRQINGARVGLAANVGLFGHGSCAILVR
jgi:acetyl-CoA acetyltransferase